MHSARLAFAVLLIEEVNIMSVVQIVHSPGIAMLTKLKEDKRPALSNRSPPAQYGSQDRLGDHLPTNLRQLLLLTNLRMAPPERHLHF